MRIAFLYTELSSYFLDCLRHLKATTNTEILLIHWPGSSDAPFQFGSLEWVGQVYLRSSHSPQAIAAIVKEFSPAILYLSGWSDKVYLNIARQHSESALVVMGMDNQWKGTLRQCLAILYSRFYLKRIIDVIWVPGSRQEAFANLLGFRGSTCWKGLYTCNVEQFVAASGLPFESRRKAFLYVGRYAEEKGLEALAKAYQAYRMSVRDPWDLVCAGRGPFHSRAFQDDAIRHMGFIQPDKLPALMGQFRGFILPSRHEPWGLVIHEATASGLPVICTDACGAAAHLVLHQQNGFICEVDNVQQLSDAMVHLSDMNEQAWTDMHQCSLRLSNQYTPDRWVRTLLSERRKNVPA